MVQQASMKSITIHGVDEQMAKLIKDRAHANRVSVNKAIKRLLEEALGIKPKSMRSHEKDFMEFCGVWSANDLAEFDDAIKDLREIDLGDWRRNVSYLTQTLTPVAFPEIGRFSARCRPPTRCLCQ